MNNTNFLKNEIWYQNIHTMECTKLQAIDDVSEAPEGRILYIFENGTKCYQQLVLNHEDVTEDTSKWLNTFVMVGIATPQLKYKSKELVSKENVSCELQADVDGNYWIPANPDDSFKKHMDFLHSSDSHPYVYQEIYSDWYLETVKRIHRLTYNKEYMEQQRNIYKMSSGNESSIIPQEDSTLSYSQTQPEITQQQGQPDFKLQYEQELITPEIAKKYLSLSAGNINIVKRNINTYVYDMMNDNWKTNGDTIKFDTNGLLRDGHQRLNAVIKANHPIWMTVCRGIDPSSFPTIDKGRHRTTGHVLMTQGIKNYNTVASILTGNINLISTGRLYANNTTTAKDRKLSDMEIYNTYLNDTEGFQEAAAFGCRTVSKIKGAALISKSWVGSLYYYLTHTGHYEKEYVTRFFDNIFSFDSGDIVPADKLRKYLLECSNKRVKLAADMLFACITKAWNAYVQNKNIYSAKYNPHREDIPKLILKDSLV